MGPFLLPLSDMWVLFMCEKNKVSSYNGVFCGEEFLIVSGILDPYLIIPPLKVL